ncbi:MAG: PEP-CTERM sorting domain-containing protein, partial [Microcystaceae cyanobacterium]
LRVDYVLPSTNVDIKRGQVFWPTDDNPLSSLNSASDHHAVVLKITTDAASVPESGSVLGFLGLGLLGLSSKLKQKVPSRQRGK